MCRSCEFLKETFPPVSVLTPTEYEFYTDVFMFLHNERDYCNVSNPINKMLIKEENANLKFLGEQFQNY